MTATKCIQACSVFQTKCQNGEEMCHCEHFIRYLLDLLVFCCCSISTDTLHIQRCSSAYHCCNVWLFALLSPSCELQPVWTFSDLLILSSLFFHLIFSLFSQFGCTYLNNNVFLPAELLLNGCYLFFTPFWVNSMDCCAWKLHEISSF